MQRIATALALVLALVGCGGDATAPTVSVSGGWSGLGTSTQVVSLTLLESAGTVSGSGTITNTSIGTRAMTVTGVFTNPDFNLTLSSGTAQPINFKGKYNASIPAQLVGAFNGSGFTGEQVILNKQ